MNRGDVNERNYVLKVVNKYITIETEKIKKPKNKNR